MYVKGIGHFYTYLYNKHVFAEKSRTNGLLKIVLCDKLLSKLFNVY